MTRIDLYRPSVPRLDLGSGPSPRDGYVGVDRVSGVNVMYWDFTSSHDWPWEDESIEALYSSHCIEHLALVNANGRDVLHHFFEQAWRVATPGAPFHLRWPVPFHPTTGMPIESAWWDPTHYRRIPIIQVTSYFSKQGRVDMGVEPRSIRCNWVLTRKVAIRELTTDGSVLEYDIELCKEAL